MPKNLFQEIVFTVMMVFVIVVCHAKRKKWEPTG